MSTVSHSIVLASDNPGKLAEFSAILSQAGIRMTPQGELGVPPADEPHATFVENALAKARHAARQTGRPTLADDSGLCVPALGNAPGVYSARYARMAGGEHSDAANNRHLIDQLADHADWRASYVAVLVYLRTPDDPLPIIVEEQWAGRIVAQARGHNGFGYDPHFFLPDLDRTAAELAPQDKNRLSHRGKALQTLLGRLLAEQGRTA